MQTETSGEVWRIWELKLVWKHGVVKVISPIDNTPASRAGVKAGDYIIKINNDSNTG